MIASRVTHQRSSIGSPVLFSRREILRAGGSGLMGLSLGGLLEADVKMRATGPGRGSWRVQIDSNNTAGCAFL